MRKNRRGKNLKWILPAGVLLLLLILIQSNGLQIASATSIKGAQNHKTTTTNVSTIDEVNQKDDQTLSHEQIVTLTDQFMDTLVQKTDNNKVMDYHTKEELLNRFDEITTRNVASTYVDSYYHEASDGLYIIPTETPPWFNKENDYDMVQLDNNKVKVEQKNKSAMYGTYTVVYEFTRDTNWKITNITHA